MSKRARYDGAEPVKVMYPPGAVYPDQEWTVEPGHWLPDDAPAALRDELLARDDWSEVQQSSGTSTSAPKKSDDDSKEG